MPTPIRIFRIPGAPDPGANLPKIPVPGLNDDFARADADTLGMTLDGKPWQVYPAMPAPATWGVRGNAAALISTAGSGGNVSVALVDGLASDGVLRVVVSAYVATGPGILFRAKDDANFLMVNASNSGRLVLWQRSAGVSTQIAAASGATPVIQSGDEVKVSLSGTAISVLLNGAPVISHTSASHLTESKYGFRGDSAPAQIGYRWGEIEFTPAGS